MKQLYISSTRLFVLHRVNEDWRGVEYIYTMWSKSLNSCWNSMHFLARQCWESIFTYLANVCVYDERVALGWFVLLNWVTRKFKRPDAMVNRTKQHTRVIFTYYNKKKKMLKFIFHCLEKKKKKKVDRLIWRPWFHFPLDVFLISGAHERVARWDKAINYKEEH